MQYFTARVRDNPDAELRQALYLEALMSHSLRVRLTEGHFQDKFRECRNCGARWIVYEEKETDVNIAIAMLTDAVRDVYDTALLVSADSDLRPAIAAVKRLRVGKRIVAAFPPRRAPKIWPPPLTATSRSATPRCPIRSSPPRLSPRAGWLSSARRTGPNRLLPTVTERGQN